MKKVLALFMLLMPFLFAALAQNASSDTGDTDNTGTIDVHVSPAYYEGKGISIDALDFGDNDTLNDRVLLYNVGKDMFLNAGGHWGTRTVTYTVGLPILLIRHKFTASAPAVTANELAEGADTDNNSDTNPDTNTGTGTTTTTDEYTYKLVGPFKNTEQADNSKRTGHYIGVVTDDKGKGKGVYYDRGSHHGIDWEFKRVENDEFKDDFVYQICINTDKNPGTDLETNRKLIANEKIEVGVFKNGNMNLVKAVEDQKITGEQEKYSYWKIVTLRQVIEDFSTTYDTEHPSDASFFMRAQGFNRMNRYNDAATSGTKDRRGWYKSGNINFHYGLKQGFTGYVADRDSTYGMFFCGGIIGGNKGDSIYQTVFIPHSGWYRVDCQGFFYNKENPNTCFAQLYAKVKGKTPNTTGHAYVNLLPKSYGEPYSGAELNPDNHANYTILPSLMMTADKKITNKVEAGVAFYNQLYPNHILIYVNKGTDNSETVSDSLELGIKLTANVPKDSYAYFDDFQLKYLGESFALDETNGNFHSGMGDGDNTAVYKNRVMILRRTLIENKWNSICLPVDLTKEQLNTAFFPNPMLAKLRNSEHYGTIEFVTVDFSKIKNDAVVMRKGQCYLIKPGYGGRVDKGYIEIGNGYNVKVTAPYYAIDRVSLTKEKVEEDLNISDVGEFIDNIDVDGNTHDYYTILGDKYKDCQLTVKGTFQKKTKTAGNTVPTGSYTFADGKLYHLTGNYAQKGFSCWIEDEHQIKDPVARHSLKFTTYINGVTDNTTSIEGFSVDTREEQVPAVYSISGQQVRRGTSSTENLPHGVYIVNGKKILVK